MRVENLQRYFAQRGMEIVKKETIDGTKVLFAEGLTNFPPKESGIQGSAYRTSASWEIDGEFKRTYEEYFQWGKKGGLSTQTNMRISSVRDIIKETLKKDRVR